MNECAVFIPSCDHYSDLWRPFFNLFWKHWPDCRFRVYLGSNYKTHDDSRVITIAIGEDKSWSDGLISMIKSIKEPYIIFLLEDFFFRRRVNNREIIESLELLNRLKGGMLRLVPNPGPDIVIKECPIGIVSSSAAYRVSTQAAIWKKVVLKRLLIQGESAWEFELNGTRRSQTIKDIFYSTTHALFPYKNHVVERGKWFPKEARRFGKMDIGCDFNARSIMSPAQYYAWYLQRVSSKLFGKVPARMKGRIRFIVRKISDRAKVCRA